MNIDFSGSKIAYNTQPLTREVTSENRKVESEGSNIETVRNGNEFRQLERQGVNFSKGEEQVIKALDRALQALQGPNTMFEVSMHKETHTIMVKVLNKETGELIREVPPEKTLDLVANMMQIAGIIIDERV